MTVFQAAALAALRDLGNYQARLASSVRSTFYPEASIARALEAALAYRATPTIDLVRLREMSTREADRLIRDLHRRMPLINAAAEAQMERFARLRVHIDNIRFSSTALMHLRSPVITIAANAALIEREFERFKNVELAALALRPIWELQRLTVKLAEAGAHRDSKDAVVAERTIEAAALQTTRTSETIVEIVRRQERWIVSQPPPATLPTFNLFEVQQGEIGRLIVGLGADRLNIEALPSVIPSILARYLCHRVIEVNNVAVAGEREPYFRPTNRLVEGAAGLPFVVATSRVAFQDFINFLFQMLYEGSGNAERLTPDLSKDELNPLWQLKQLRLEAFHDVEHGDDRDIAEKQQKIAAVYCQLIGKPAPQGEDDYRIAQVKLLQGLTGMLELLLAKLSGR